MKKVCVFGTYKDLGEEQKENIVRLGRLLAENGIIVVSGGFGGSMECVSKGAKSGGGKTIGVTYYKDKAAPYKKVNEFIDEEVKTKNIFARIETMMKISEGFIMLQGGTGTLLELAAILEHVNKGLMPPKPIVAIGDFWKGVIGNLSDEEILSEKVKTKLNIDKCSGLLTFVKDVDEAVKEIVNRT